MTKEDIKDILDVVYLIMNIFVIGGLFCGPIPLGMYIFGPSLGIAGIGVIVGMVLVILYFILLFKIKPRWIEIFDFAD